MEEEQKEACQGDCRGTGLVPVIVDKKRKPKSLRTAAYLMMWHTRQQEVQAEDKRHLVPCLDCGGTGKNRKHGKK